EAGFPDAAIVCSGDLDEYAIAEMKARGAKINVWGVGTKLATGCPDAALNGIYKLGGMRPRGEPWKYRIKLSDEPFRTSCPGRLQVRRFHQPDGKFIADAIYEIDHGIGGPCVIVNQATNVRREIPAATDFSDLLVPIFCNGQLVYRIPEIRAVREHRRK